MRKLVYYCFFVAVLAISAEIVVSNGQVTPNLLVGGKSASGPQGQTQPAPESAHLINPEELVAILQSPKAEKPLILNVGPHLLYMQAHIPGSEYIGAGSDLQRN
jgi:hypothetical protein